MIGAAKAATCPPAEVVFARGRMEPPGPGQVGAAFVNALRTPRGPNVALYSVKYPVDTQADVAANDMSRHVQWMIRNCPNTRLILGGYSLGAVATDLILAMPISAFTFNSPLPKGTDRHVAVVALFGNGANWAAPITLLNPAYQNRTIDLCHSDDLDLQSEQPVQVAGRLAGSPGARLHPVRHGGPGGQVRLRPPLRVWTFVARGVQLHNVFSRPSAHHG